MTELLTGPCITPGACKCTHALVVFVLPFPPTSSIFSCPSPPAEELGRQLPLRDPLQPDALRQGALHGQDPQQGLRSLPGQKIRQDGGVHQVAITIDIIVITRAGEERGHEARCQSPADSFTAPADSENPSVPGRMLTQLSVAGETSLSCQI